MLRPFQKIFNTKKEPDFSDSILYPPPRSAVGIIHTTLLGGQTMPPFGLSRLE